MLSNKYIFPNIMIEMVKSGDNLQTLSQKIGMNYQTLSARLRGIRNFDLSEIYCLMKIYNSSFEYLFERTDKSNEPKEPAA